MKLRKKRRNLLVLHYAITSVVELKAGTSDFRGHFARVGGELRNVPFLTKILLE